MIKKILHGAMPEAADLIPEKDLITFSAESISPEDKNSLAFNAAAAKSVSEEPP